MSVLLAFCVLGPQAAVAQDVDTFHLRLYQDGAQLAAAGDYRQAVDKLRLACFGMLDAPSVLGPCLGRLLATQDAADSGDDEIEATVDRLLEVERRFKGWSEPDSAYALTAELRRTVETLFVRFGTAEGLARIPGLGAAALEKQAEKIAALPMDERRRELNLLVQRQAQVPIWHVMSAELSLDEGDPRAAAGAAREILGKFEGNAAARCVLGRARAAQKQCDDGVVEHLRMCPDDHAVRSEIDLELVRCLATSARWSEADAAWRRLPSDVREQRTVRRLRKQIEKGLEGEARAGGNDASIRGDVAVDAAADPPAGAEPTGGAAGTDRPPRAATAATVPIYVPPPGLEEDLVAAPVGPEPAFEEAPARAVVAESSPDTSRAEFGDLPDDDQDVLRRVRDALAAERRDLYPDLWTEVRRVARRHDDSAVAQRLAGSLAFRLGKWRDAVRFLRRDESLAASRPQLQLVLAMALHYDGDTEEAREVFERCRPLLASTPWVEYWAAELNG